MVALVVASRSEPRHAQKLQEVVPLDLLPLTGMIATTCTHHSSVPRPLELRGLVPILTVEKATGGIGVEGKDIIHP
jgi:hypothetical protein